MKRKFILLALMLVLSLLVAACGSGGNNENSGDSQNASQNEGGESNENSENQEEESSGPAYETSYSAAKVWTNNIGTTWVQTIVEITNTGDTNLYLSSGAYDLEDSEGSLVAAQTMVSAFPDVIAPGEKGYLYDETTLDDYEGDGNLTVLPRPDVEEATVDLIRYTVSDISVSDGSYGGIDVIGRVENVTEETDNMVYVVAFFYDAESNPIGSAFTIITEDLAPGDKIGFEMSSFSMPSDITTDMIAETVVYAYPSQMQF